MNYSYEYIGVYIYIYMITIPIQVCFLATMQSIEIISVIPFQFLSYDIPFLFMIRMYVF